MNIAQVCRQALFDANVVLADNTTSALFTQAELLAWAQAGEEVVGKALRNAEADYGMVIRTSTDSTFVWEEESFAMTGLALISTTKSYTLPPDFIEMRYIRPTTSGREDTRFSHLDISDPLFVQTNTESTPQRDVIYWDIIGERTLFIPNAPTASLDIEFGYIARQRRLRVYATGTLNLTKDDTAVVGSSTEWAIERLNVPMEIIANTTDTAAVAFASQTTTLTFVDPSAIYPKVESFTTDTALVLEATWTPATDTSAPYMLASVPNTPREHHHILVRYMVTRILEKSRAYKAAKEVKGDFQRELAQLRSDVEERQSANLEVVEDFGPDNTF